MTDPLTATGLFLNIVGTWCIAYELLWGYPKKNRKAIAETRLAGLQEFMAGIEASISRLKEPPYTPLEKEAEIDEFREEWAPNIKSLQTEIRELGEGHTERSFYVAMIGVFLLSVGFGLQLLANL